MVVVDISKEERWNLFSCEFLKKNISAIAITSKRRINCDCTVAAKYPKVKF